MGEEYKLTETEKWLIEDELVIKGQFKNINALCLMLAKEKNDVYLEKILKKEEVNDIYQELLLYCLYNNLIKSTEILLSKKKYEELTCLEDYLFIVCKHNFDQLAKIILNNEKKIFNH